MAQLSFLIGCKSNDTEKEQSEQKHKGFSHC
ncbi:hypothetical protein COLO4_29383 [Corchorus olitorius]|uniref:Uncharacterized protein n=1 Tax=Corchorus olitorius TaxID=93759 RepID=A0A1R3HEU0_9ROSI|nr:hypothetical protein COLO4_29383 [Corchorus olitorius]